MQINLLLVPFLIAVNAFFVAAEYTVVASRAKHIDSLRQRGHRAAAEAMIRLKGQTAATIGTIQVCITMTNLLLGWIGEPAMSWLLERILGPLVTLLPPTVFRPLSISLSFIGVTLLTVVFSELLPKALTLRYVEAGTILTARPVLTIRSLVWPLVWAMNKLANLVTLPLRLGRVDQDDDERVTTAELRLLTTTAAEEGELTPREREVILNALTLADRSANKIMVPRVRITFLDLQKSLEDNLAIVARNTFTRLPLCDGGMDNVVGTVHIKDLLHLDRRTGSSQVLRKIAREPVFVPETKTVDKLLSLFAEKNVQMVIVLDEYGGMSGLVTLRDAVDRVLGRDTDPPEFRAIDPLTPKLPDEPLVFPGEARILDVAQKLGRHDWCVEEDAATLGGLVLDYLGHFPQPEESIEIEGVRLRVLEVSGRIVDRIEVAPVICE